MATFTYTGQQGDMVIRGAAFPPGVAVEVACDDLAAKLRRLDYFAEAGGEAVAAGEELPVVIKRRPGRPRKNEV